MAQRIMCTMFSLRTRGISVNYLIKQPCMKMSIMPNPKMQMYQTQQTRGKHRKSLYKTEEAKQIRFYFLRRYLEYLKNYDKVLEKKFPAAMRVYRVFTVGIKDFLRDLKEFTSIWRMLNDPKKGKFSSLTRREIELYHQMPKDMIKVAPVIILSTLPFSNFILPLVYMFPRNLLTSHFWNLQQKAEFHIDFLRHRLVQNRAVFRCVQAELKSVKCHNLRLYNEWNMILGQIGSGVQPSVEQIIKCKDLFMGPPYHIFYLKHKHVKLLLKIHDLHTLWFRRSRLEERAVILMEMDKAILREGGVHNLPPECLKTACLLRGFNPTNLPTEEMVAWLNKWMAVSKVVDRENLSLLLHCPILLAYNEPSNWALIYSPKR